jgi:hypothetical protein
MHQDLCPKPFYWANLHITQLRNLGPKDFKYSKTVIYECYNKLVCLSKANHSSLAKSRVRPEPTLVKHLSSALHSREGSCHTNKR